MIKKLFLNFLSGLVLLAVLWTPGSYSSEDPLRIGFIFGSDIGLYGWGYSHDQCRIAIEEEYGETVEISVFEEANMNIPDTEVVMRTMLDSGHRLFFITNPRLQELTHGLARQYPEAKFEIATGDLQSVNVGVYAPRFYVGRFSAGVVSGLLTRTGIIGYIAPFPIPEVVRGINAVTLGARNVNPDVEVHVMWTNSWNEPEPEAAATAFLLNSGADIFVPHTNGSETLRIAEQAGKLAFGKGSNMSQFGPNAQIATIQNDWNQFCVKRVEQVLNGAWESTNTWGGVDGPRTRLTHYNESLNPQIIDFIQHLEHAIYSNVTHPFSGPIYREDGTLVVEEQHYLPDEVLRDLDWYVEGVVLH